VELLVESSEALMTAEAPWALEAELSFVAKSEGPAKPPAGTLESRRPALLDEKNSSGAALA
jgi:hypothetical protein